MVEFGTASDLSAAFILETTGWLRLLSESTPAPFLTSFEVISKTAAGDVIGSFVGQHYPERQAHWRLLTETTSCELLPNPGPSPELATGPPAMAFIDGGHHHPWPLMDLVAPRRHLLHGRWVVLQDCQMTGCWLADCVEYGAPCPAPVRGVNFIVSHYHGTKLLGTGLCFNCAALRLDIDDTAYARFVDTCLGYQPEIAFDHWEELRAASRGDTPRRAAA